MIIGPLIRFWHSRQRKADMEILWPACKDEAPDLDHAKAAFYYHASHDRAWTDHYSASELITFVDNLT